MQNWELAKEHAPLSRIAPLMQGDMDVQMTYFPEVVQVVPRADRTVSVYFSDGKIVSYDVNPLLDKGVFRALADGDTFLNCCTIMNDTHAWDIERNGGPARRIDIDPETLYALDIVEDRLEVS